MKLSFLEKLAANILLSGVGAYLKGLGYSTLVRWLVVFGKAFGPAGLRHFSELSADEQEELLRRIPVLNNSHTDWPKPLQWVDRTLTTWVGPPPTVADIVAGNTNNLKPIPDNGKWYALKGYVASTDSFGLHVRFGFRYDDVDGYWTLSFTVKKVN